MKLKSIKAEAAACRKRCAGLKIGDNVLHLHHEVLMERLTEPIENRIAYVLETKTDNVALRLRMMGPVAIDSLVRKDAALEQAVAALEQAYAAWEQAYAAWEQAYAAWEQAFAALEQAVAARKQAFAALEQAVAAWEQAFAALEQAYLPHYRRIFPDSPWDGKTIFAGKFKEVPA